MSSSSKTILSAGSLSDDTPRLVGRFGGELGEVRLGDRMTFGRSPENTVQIHDRELSKEHFTIERLGSSFLLRDTGSSNGTFVNGRKIRDLALRDGDELAFGTSVVIFHSGKQGNAVVWKPELKPVAPRGKASERSMLADLLIRGLAKEKKEPAVLLEKSAKAAMQIIGADWAVILLRTRQGAFSVRAEARQDSQAPAPPSLFELAEWVTSCAGTVRCDDFIEEQSSGRLARLGGKPLPANLTGMRSLVAMEIERAEATLGVMIAACVERAAAFDEECAQLFTRTGQELAARLPPVAELEFWG